MAAEAAKAGLRRRSAAQAEVDAKVALPERGARSTRSTSRTSRASARAEEEAIAQIREILTPSERWSERRAVFEKELRRAASVAVRLEPPRATVAIPAGAPATGPATAPVTIVEFLDYQCPYCHRAQAVVDEVLQQYEGKVRFVHRDFPLDGHAEAVPAARAARCAGEQGKFWEYHRSLLVQAGRLDRRRPQRRAARRSASTAAPLRAPAWPPTKFDAGDPERDLQPGQRARA